MKSISIQISEKNQAISRQLMCHFLNKNNDGIPTLSHSHQRKNGQQEQGILCARTISIEALSLIIETSTEEAHSLAAYCYRSEVFCQMRLEGNGLKRNKKRKLLVANLENLLKITHSRELAFFVHASLGSN